MKGNIAIIKILLANVKIKAITNGIYPNMAHQGEAFPFILVHKKSVTPNEESRGSSAMDTDEVHVYNYGDTYDGAIDLSESVRGALDGYRGNPGGVQVQRIRYKGETDEVEMEPTRTAYIVKQVYEVREIRTPEFKRYD